VALDEREHKEQSLARMHAPRFGLVRGEHGAVPEPGPLTLQEGVE
jgi:hypothetical protein